MRLPPAANSRIGLRSLRKFGCIAALTAIASCNCSPSLECQNADGPLKVPFCEDLAAVGPDDYLPLHAALLNAVAGFDLYASQDDWQEMQRVGSGEYIRGRVLAYRDANQLNAKRFRSRARVVAKVYASERYDHGIDAKWSYVIVDGTHSSAWRILIVPSDPSRAISVLHTWVFDSTGAPSAHKGSERFTAAIHLAPKIDSTRWFRSLSVEVQRCARATLRACLVNTVSGSRIVAGAGETPLPPDPNLPTDVWIWVDEQGCVCLGTQCHSEFVETVRKGGTR